MIIDQEMQIRFSWQFQQGLEQPSDTISRSTSCASTPDIVLLEEQKTEETYNSQSMSGRKSEEMHLSTNFPIRLHLLFQIDD
jgi:hypothetical protein